MGAHRPRKESRYGRRRVGARRGRSGRVRRPDRNGYSIQAARSGPARFHRGLRSCRAVAGFRGRQQPGLVWFDGSQWHGEQLSGFGISIASSVAVAPDGSVWGIGYPPASATLVYRVIYRALGWASLILPIVTIAYPILVVETQVPLPAASHAGGGPARHRARFPKICRVPSLPCGKPLPASWWFWFWAAAAIGCERSIGRLRRGGCCRCAGWRPASSQP
jgi:hypothetical protein